MKRYCIGCVYLCFQPEEWSRGSTWTGAWKSEEAALACAKGHWKTQLEEGPLGFNFEKAMETAQTCMDFNERPAPADQP